MKKKKYEQEWQLICDNVIISRDVLAANGEEFARRIDKDFATLTRQLAEARNTANMRRGMIEQLRERLAETKKEVEALRGKGQFADAALRIVKDCILDGIFEADAEQLAELAVDAGLIRKEQFDPDRHADIANASYYTVGDPLYTWTTPPAGGE